MELLVYKITNLITSKIYVGVTQKSLAQRWAQHKSQVTYVGKSNRKICRFLHTSMKKHGIDNFTIEVIDTAKDLIELYKKETEYILKLNSLAPNGYNLKLSDNPRYCSPYTRKLLSEQLSGEKNGMFGKKGSEKQKQFILAYNKSRSLGGIRHDKKYNKFCVRCTFEGKRHSLGYYDSLEKAQEVLATFKQERNLK